MKELIIETDHGRLDATVYKDGTLSLDLQDENGRAYIQLSSKDSTRLYQHLIGLFNTESRPIKTIDDFLDDHAKSLGFEDYLSLQNDLTLSDDDWYDICERYAEYKIERTLNQILY